MGSRLGASQPFIPPRRPNMTREHYLAQLKPLRRVLTRKHAGEDVHLLPLRRHLSIAICNSGKRLFYFREADQPFMTISPYNGLTLDFSRYDRPSHAKRVANDILKDVRSNVRILDFDKAKDRLDVIDVNDADAVLPLRFYTAQRLPQSGHPSPYQFALGKPPGADLADVSDLV